MKKLVDLIKSFPWYGYLFAALTVILQVVIYFVFSEVNLAKFGTFTPVEIKIPAIDDQIPFIVNSSIFYFLTYPYYFVSALAITRCKKSELVNQAIGYTLVIIIGMLFFIFMPTYLDREAEGILQAVQAPGATNRLMNFIYQNDGVRTGVNLFPSYHCAITVWWCLATLFDKKCKFGYKMFTVMASIIICLSTLTTKQHYFIDVVGGIGLSVIAFFLIKLVNPGKYIIKEK